MKARLMTTGMTIEHEGQRKYLKTKSFTMGNIIHCTLRSEGGELESVQFTLEEEVKVLS